MSHISGSDGGHHDHADGQINVTDWQIEHWVDSNQGASDLLSYGDHLFGTPDSVDVNGSAVSPSDIASTQAVDWGTSGLNGMKSSTTAALNDDPTSLRVFPADVLDVILPHPLRSADDANDYSSADLPLNLLAAYSASPSQYPLSTELLAPPDGAAAVHTPTIQSSDQGSSSMQGVLRSNGSSSADARSNNLPMFPYLVAPAPPLSADHSPHALANPAGSPFMQYTGRFAGDISPTGTPSGHAINSTATSAPDSAAASNRSDSVSVSDSESSVGAKRSFRKWVLNENNRGS